jgi:hypothetical protein
MTRPEPDPPSRFEDEGIPDLQEGTPEQQWRQDPQEMPLPGREPSPGLRHALDGDGEDLDDRLAAEVPDVSEADIPTGVSPDLDADDPALQTAGRLVAPDEGTREDTEKDEVATDVGPDFGGFTAEEAAIHIEPER